MAVGGIVWVIVLAIYLAFQFSFDEEKQVGEMENFRDILFMTGLLVSFLLHTVYPVVESYHVEKTMIQFSGRYLPEDGQESGRGFYLNGKVRVMSFYFFFCCFRL
jgi:hypothetical protein